MYDGAAMWGRLLLFAMLAVPMLAAHVSQAPAGAASQSAEEHLSLAKRYLAEQKTDLAIAELKQAVALDPANVEARGNLGVLLYFRGDYAGAVSNLRTALNAQPDLWKIQALLGMAENRAGDRQASRNDLETAFPHLTDAKVQLDAGEVLADLYSNDGELEKASSIVSTLLAARPGDASLLYLSYRIDSDMANRAILAMAIADPGSAELNLAMARELAKERKHRPGDRRLPRGSANQSAASRGSYPARRPLLPLAGRNATGRCCKRVSSGFECESERREGGARVGCSRGAARRSENRLHG